jgi:hypothetical protein
MDDKHDRIGRRVQRCILGEASGREHEECEQGSETAHGSVR